MALAQAKLSKSEWNAIEIPVNENDKYVLSFLISASKNKDLTLCSKLTLSQYTKLSINEEVHYHLYTTFIQPKLEKHLDLLGISSCLTKRPNKRTTISKADVIRLNNTTKHLTTDTTRIVEFILLDAVSTLCQNLSNRVERLSVLHGLATILSYQIPTLNPYLKNVIQELLKKCNSDFDSVYAFKNSAKFLIDNKYTSKVWMYSLFPFQKQLISLCAAKTSFISAISAPTGRGKTISPIALLTHKRIIFVCAARHVGLALAKSAVSSGKKIAFAFNCASAGDIRLHYSSAKESIRDYRTGGIRKVDNSIGDNVELMISDVKSALIACYYMTAFNDKNDLLLYWDEPTISLDTNNHPLHSNMSELWRKHTIPNVVLSSATLPSSDEMTPMLRTHATRFDARIAYIECTDMSKSVEIVAPDCSIITPHSIVKTAKDLRSVVNRISSNESLLRYISLEDACNFQIKANEKEIYPAGNSTAIDFPNISSFSVGAIKLRYLSVLRALTQNDFTDFEAIRDYCKSHHTPFSVLLTTTDAHTLTNGPTIYLANNVEKVALFLLQNSKIAKAALRDVYSDLEHNNKLMSQISKLEKEEEDQDGGKNGESDQKTKQTSAVSKMISQLRMQMKKATLHNMFVPNTEEHLRYWTNDEKYNPNAIPFMPNIDEEQTSEILYLQSVDDKWKLLLLLGVGILDNGMNNAYIEKMKELASEQKLFIIIAGSDYVFGTNYQFAHAFIGKDMEQISQDKIVQCIGRVGRTNKLSSYTVRLRSEELGKRLFMLSNERPELENMIKLFT